MKMAHSSSMRILAGIAFGAMLVGCEGGREVFTERTHFDRQPWTQPVPKAECGATDRTENALQGQVPLRERETGRSLEGYECNLVRVGHDEGVGAGWQFAWYDDCAYYGTASHTRDLQTGERERRQRENPGVVVLDVAASTAPVITGYLDTPAMLDPWESLKVNEARMLLGAVNGQAGGGGPEIDLYDISGDCADPVLLASQAVGQENDVGHGGNFMPDGLTYYGAGGGLIRAIDIEDPTDPTLITDEFPFGTHDISGSTDGTRAYLAVAGGLGGSQNGLVTLDVSEIQFRRDDPQARVISEFFWDDGAVAQHTQPFFIDGHPYMLFVDEGASGFTGQGMCDRGLPAFAFARIIDMADERNPRLVSQLKLEVHDPANCREALEDNDDGGVFIYDAHYCTLDDIDDASLLACSYFESGLRVFDIRDPFRPREIAYYNPPTEPGFHEGSYYNLNGECTTTDWASAHPRFRLDRKEIWFTTQCGGIHVVRFRAGVLPAGVLPAATRILNSGG